MKNLEVVSLSPEDLFTPKKQELESLAKKYNGLRDKSIKNKDDYKITHIAEQELVKIRTGISKVRLEYTRPLEQAKKDAIGKEKELLGVITPVEDDLKEQKRLYNEEQERVKKEKQEVQRKILQDRVEKLALYEFSYHDLYKLSQLEEGSFLELLNEKKEAFKKKQEERKEKERQNLINLNINDLMRADNIEEIENMKVAIIKSFGSFEEFQETYDNKRELLEMKANKEKLDKEKREFEEKKQKEADQKQKELDEKKAKEEKERIQKEAKEKAEKELEERKINTKAEIRKINENTNESFLMNLSDGLEKFSYVNIDFDEVNEALKQRILVLNKARVEQEEKEKLEKKKKYKDFLKKNGITQEQLESGEIIKKTDEEKKTISFYRKLDVFKY